MTGSDERVARYKAAMMDLWKKDALMYREALTNCVAEAVQADFERRPSHEVAGIVTDIACRALRDGKMREYREGE